MKSIAKEGQENLDAIRIDTENPAVPHSQLCIKCESSDASTKQAISLSSDTRAKNPCVRCLRFRFRMEAKIFQPLPSLVGRVRLPMPFARWTSKLCLGHASKMQKTKYAVSNVAERVYLPAANGPEASAKLGFDGIKRGS